MSLRRTPLRGILRRLARAGSAGFTLTEVLIVSAVGLVALSAIVAVVISYVRSRERVEAVLQLQEQWSRLQFLLDREIQEAVPVTSSSSLSSTCGTITPILELEVPGQSTRIAYYLSGTDLRRCGPAIDASGNLTATVSDALVLSRVSSFSVDTSSDSRRPTYSLSLSAANGVTYSNQSQASGSSFRARTIN